jgi:hypothetical protein
MLHARGRAKVLLEQYVAENHKQYLLDYNAVLNLSERRYSGKDPTTRIFVIGNPGAALLY